MNNRQLHIQNLLDRYYRGETELHEELELMRFFTSPDAALPPELEQERSFFMSLAAASEENIGAFDQEMPPETRARIERALDMAAYGSQSRRRLRRWKSVSAAACVAALITGTLILSRLDTAKVHISGTHAAPTELVAAASPQLDSAVYTGIENDENEAPAVPADLPPVKSASDKKVSHPRQTKHIAMASRSIEAQVETDDGMIEITDPKEAGRILAQVNDMLELNISKSRDACQSADIILTDNFNKIRTTIYEKI
ncbi:MAG: hypothetical protein J6L73_00830 [Muribaculaceae bacterium]|nr:hypothetical protein [Muribaculaceae bacterium]